MSQPTVTMRLTSGAVNRGKSRTRYGIAGYEYAKAAWIRENQEATPEQYQAAMTRLARKHRI